DRIAWAGRALLARFDGRRRDARVSRRQGIAWRRDSQGGVDVLAATRDAARRGELEDESDQRRRRAGPGARDPLRGAWARGSRRGLDLPAVSVAARGLRGARRIWRQARRAGLLLGAGGPLRRRNIPRDAERPLPVGHRRPFGAPSPPRRD